MSGGRQEQRLPLLKGRYQGVEVLGEGAMARTLLAQDLEQGGEVAVKLLYPSRLASLKDFELFEREAKALAKLSHAQIPEYIDHFVVEDQEEQLYALVQQHIDGESLKVRLEGGDRMAEGEVISLAMDVLEVLDYLSKCDPPVVHRDIKPANLVYDSKGRLHLVDFGAVREAVRQTIQAGSTVVGTYGYMPPEQLVGDAVPASDIFALGVTLVSCLTRKPAHMLSSDGFTVDVEALNLNISEDFRKILGAMTARRIEDRYSEPWQIVEDLQLVREGERPRNVSSLERQIAVRKKNKERAIRRRMARGRTWIYRLAAVFAVAMFGVAIYILGSQVAASAASGFAAALAVGGGGLIGSLVMLGRRYIDDSWLPPSDNWRSSEARVVSHERVAEQQQGALAAVYKYGRGHGGEELKGMILGSHKEVTEMFPVGASFTVYYDPKQPSNKQIEVSQL